MAVNESTMQVFLKLERVMMLLDAQDNPLADDLRDAMDPVWCALSDEQRRWLEERTIQAPAGAHRPTDLGFASPPPMQIRTAGIRVRKASASAGLAWGADTARQASAPGGMATSW